MANSSLIIESTDQNGKKLQKTLGYINPNATDANVCKFAKMLTALTTNQYVGASRVDKADISNADQGE